MSNKDFIEIKVTTKDRPISLESGVHDFHGMTVEAKGGIVLADDGVTILNAVIAGPVKVEGNDAVIKNCTVRSSGEAIVSSGAGLILQGNKINGSVSLVNGSYNSLVAQNKISGDISVTGGYNCAVILNNAKAVNCQKSKNIYVVENIADSISLSSNNYLLCDQNKCGSVEANENLNFNGDNITDVDARIEFGADEALLPHINRDLFVGMQRRNNVNCDEPQPLNKYITNSLVNEKTVIVPPGAYITPEPIKLSGNESGATVYAYGAMAEMVEYGSSVVVSETQNVTVKGLNIGYVKQPCGQVTVLEERDSRTFTVVPYAGSVNDFGRTDPTLFSVGFTDLFETGKIYPFGCLGGGYSIEKNEDGTMTVTLPENSMWCGKLHKGYRFVCRLGGGDKLSMYIVGSENILFKDVSLLCHSACLAVVAGGVSENIHFYRWYNGNEPAPIIDKETFDRYREIEKKYGVEDEVYVDELGRYRGGKPLIGSSDATHIVGCKEGVHATSCLFESMCDDGSNQRSASSRLAGVKDNGDGTSTLFYKGSVAEIYCLHYFNPKNPRPSSCCSFVKGDRILAYTSTGITFCDTECLSDSVTVEDYEFTLDAPEREPRHYTDTLRSVTVRTDALNLAALDGFDLSDNRYEMKNKVLVDNLSRNSANFRFDNVMVRNTRSRGILVKTVGANIKNCTFRNLGHTGVLLSVEFVWGESSVSQDVSITGCLFDNLGFINGRSSDKTLSPIAIRGLSSTVSEDSLLYKNILIDGNKFINNTHNYAVTVNSAQNVKIINNVFEEGVGESQEAPKKVIDIETAMNVEISNNKYSKYLPSVADGITAKNFKNVYGTDIQMQGDIQ